MTKLALFGGSFNPPGVHHRQIAERLLGDFDRVIVVPCGPRPDKPVTNDVEPIYRAAMVDMTFAGLDRVEVELADLEASTFTRTWDLQQRYVAQGDVWHVVGADLVTGGAAASAVGQWHRGGELWERANFAVVQRPGIKLAVGDRPPRHELFEVDYDGASSEIRQRIFAQQPTDALVVPRVAAYIQRHHLYRGSPSATRCTACLAGARLFVVADSWNQQATRQAAEFDTVPIDQADLILVIGGDGTMLRAIREHWRRRLPFFGLNAGHVGFLLNEQPPHRVDGTELVLRQVPLLWTQTEGLDGTNTSSLAFNDAWVERATGQTAWIEVKIDGQVRMPQLVADGALVSTAAGSASYARAMGATPVPLDTPCLLLVGSNVLTPDHWRPVVLPDTAELELTTLDPDKRPLRAFTDGVPYGDVRALRVRTSRIAAVELAFDPQEDPSEKLARIQFPK